MWRMLNLPARRFHRSTSRFSLCQPTPGIYSSQLKQRQILKSLKALLNHQRGGTRRGWLNLWFYILKRFSLILSDCSVDHRIDWYVIFFFDFIFMWCDVSDSCGLFITFAPKVFPSSWALQHEILDNGRLFLEHFDKTTCLGSHN